VVADALRGHDHRRRTASRGCGATSAERLHHVLIGRRHPRPAPGSSIASREIVLARRRQARPPAQRYQLPVGGLLLDDVTVLAQEVPGANDDQIRWLLRRARVSDLGEAGRIALGVVGLGIAWSRCSSCEATLSTHEEVDARQTDLVVSADTKGGEENQTLSEMVQAQLLACRLEVESDYSGPIERLGDGRYRAVLVPALDDSNRKQFGAASRTGSSTTSGSKWKSSIRSADDADG
jgi:hypothetical protein